MNREQDKVGRMMWEALDLETQRDWDVAQAIARAAANPLVQGSVNMLFEPRGIDQESRRVCRQALESRLATDYGLSADQFGRVCVAVERNTAEAL